jgi:hypothetical protein
VWALVWAQVLVVLAYSYAVVASVVMLLVMATPPGLGRSGDPRVNIQNDRGKAKAYQVRQVLKAIDKKEAM